MKNVFFIAIAIILTICGSKACCFGVEIDPPYEEKYQIRFNNNQDLQINGTELDVKIDFFSDFTDNACLILSVVKEFSKEDHHIYEGFRDSLEIDNFYIRSYSIKIYNPSNLSSISLYDNIMNGSISPIDFPVYVKNIFINTGKNYESFKIAFPENISSTAGSIYVDIAIVRFNKDIKRKFEMQTRLTYLSYYKIFPDSSVTSFIFTEPKEMNNLSAVHTTEHYSGKCIDFKNVTYYNHRFQRIYIKKQI